MEGFCKTLLRDALASHLGSYFSCDSLSGSVFHRRDGIRSADGTQEYVDGVSESVAYFLYDE